MINVRVSVCLLALVYDTIGENTSYLRLEPKNPDDSSIERPCGATYDVNCVRQYFSEHAQCKKTYGPVPDSLVRTEYNLYFPRVNLTFTSLNLQTGGINGRIDEFYINKDTDKAVIAIEFRNLSMSSSNAYFRFHRRGKEPVVTRSGAGVVYPSILITAVIPKINDLQLDKAEYVAFITDPNAQFFISPTATESSDPQVLATFAEFLNNVPNNLQEAVLTDAAFYPATFIQYNICDFGLKIL